jgi:MOSC domain-containing protein YiiM
MDPRTEAPLIPGRGLEGSADNSPARQVTLIEAEIWDSLMHGLATQADPASRRANFMVRGISLARTRGRVLRLGAVRLEIAGETKPCEQMETVTPGLERAMYDDWRGGVFARVLDEGIVRVGDVVEWDDSQRVE